MNKGLETELTSYYKNRPVGNLYGQSIFDAVGSKIREIGRDRLIRDIVAETTELLIPIPCLAINGLAFFHYAIAGGDVKLAILSEIGILASGFLLGRNLENSIQRTVLDAEAIAQSKQDQPIS